VEIAYIKLVTEDNEGVFAKRRSWKSLLVHTEVKVKEMTQCRIRLVAVIVKKEAPWLWVV